LVIYVPHHAIGPLGRVPGDDARNSHATCSACQSLSFSRSVSIAVACVEEPEGLDSIHRCLWRDNCSLDVALHPPKRQASPQKLSSSVSQDPISREWRRASYPAPLKSRRCHHVFFWQSTAGLRCISTFSQPHSTRKYFLQSPP